MPKSSRRVRVGITMGDPSGIGPFITAKALKVLREDAEFVMVGDRFVFEKALSLEGAKVEHIGFIDLGNVRKDIFQFGRIAAEYGRASIEYLDQAWELISRGKIDCLVTSPISKEAINLAGYNYSGHTEYLSRKTKTQDFVMMLLNDYLRFSLVSRHIPLKDVAKVLNAQDLEKTILLTHASLQKLFSIKHPRIVVCALNPHASDNGLIGKEENKIIKPVLRRLKRRVKNIIGPLAADTAVLKAKKNEFDCVIAMYHDQALIPLKLTGQDSGVNITLGLPFVRTSPLHGTAFELAGKNPHLAKPDSLIASVKLAIKCTQNLKNA